MTVHVTTRAPGLLFALGRLRLGQGSERLGHVVPLLVAQAVRHALEQHRGQLRQQQRTCMRALLLRQRACTCMHTLAFSGGPSTIHTASDLWSVQEAWVYSVIMEHGAMQQMSSNMPGWDSAHL